MSANKGICVSLWLSPEDVLTLRRAATNTGLTVSDIIRQGADIRVRELGEVGIDTSRRRRGRPGRPVL